LAAALLWVAGVTAGLAENNGSYRLVYDSRHLQADCQESGSAPEPYARHSSMGYLYLFTFRFTGFRVNITVICKVHLAATATAYRRVDNKKAAFDSWTRRSDGVANWKVWRTTLDPHSYNGVRKLCESEASVVGSFHDIDGTSHRPASSELVHLLQQRDVSTV